MLIALRAQSIFFVSPFGSREKIFALDPKGEEQMPGEFD